jgi:hypothetical protein
VSVLTPGLDRFSRQRSLSGFGPAAQQRLADARVHVVGAGPVAAPALRYLARAGVGTIYLDDGAEVEPGEAGGWLYAPDQAGTPRMLAALEVLRAEAPGVEIRFHASDTMATATLVCATSEAVARSAAERARQSGLPQVVAIGDGEGGEVLTIPVGAPCIGCAARPGARVAARGAAAAALGSLAALELVQVITRLAPDREVGRRLTLADGLPRVEATVRRPTCDCRIVY